MKLLDHVIVLFLNIFRRGDTNLQSHPQCTRIPFSPHPHQHLFFPVFFFFFLIIAILDKCEVRSHGFNWHFPDELTLRIFSFLTCHYWFITKAKWKRCTEAGECRASMLHHPPTTSMSSPEALWILQFKGLQELSLQSSPLLLEVGSWGWKFPPSDQLVYLVINPSWGHLGAPS